MGELRVGYGKGGEGRAGEGGTHVTTHARFLGGPILLSVNAEECGQACGQVCGFGVVWWTGGVRAWVCLVCGGGELVLGGYGRV